MFLYCLIYRILLLLSFDLLSIGHRKIPYLVTWVRLAVAQKLLQNWGRVGVEGGVEVINSIYLKGT